MTIGDLVCTIVNSADITLVIRAVQDANDKHINKIVYEGPANGEKVEGYYDQTITFTEFKNNRLTVLIFDKTNKL